MKLGISIMWRGATIDSTKAIAQQADRLGFDYLWLTEAWGLETLSTAGYLLGITPRIKIGVGCPECFFEIPRRHWNGMCDSRSDSIRLFRTGPRF